MPESTATPDHDVPPPHPGRPRTRGTDEAILRATLALLSEGGLEAVTMAAVAERAGVARATVYLRWPTRDALLAAATRLALGQPAFPLTGDIATDIRTGVRRAAQALAEPLFLAVFPEVVRALLHHTPAADYNEVAPNRRAMAAQYAEHAKEQGFRADVDPTLAFDLIVGTVLNHVLATRKAPRPADAERLTDVIISGLRVPSATTL